MNHLLKSYLDRIGLEFTTNWYNIRDIQDWMMEEIYRKRKSFPVWRKKVLFSYKSWIKNHSNKNILQTPEKKDEILSNFFFKKLNLLFHYFFKKMFGGFEENHLKLVNISSHSKIHHKEDLFFEYKYMLSDEEVNIFKNFKKNFSHPDHYHRIINYIFNLIVMVFGKLVKDIIKEDIQITMLCAQVKNNEEEGEFLHFLMVSRKIDKEFLKIYLFSLIYHFAQKLPNVNQMILAKLRMKNDLIYPIALNSYPKSKNSISKVFFTLKRKCQILQEVTPLLDVLNYVASRIEDSIFNTNELILNIISENIVKDNDENLTENLLKIWDFLNSGASLFSTFQSNNRADRQKQYQLFFFYTQFFCVGGIEMMQMNKAFYFPEILKYIISSSALNPLSSLSANFFNNFIFQGLSIPLNSSFDYIFEKIFQNTIEDTNENFFNAFLFSLNAKFHLLITEIQNSNSHFNYSFDKIVEYMFLVLQKMVEIAFIAPKPELVQDNFRDKISRYTPEKIALRVLELVIFKDIPLSDNNWQDYFLSRNKKFVKKIFSKSINLDDNFFFSQKRLLKINMIYERGLLNNTDFLEEWLLTKIVKKFLKFQHKISNILPESYSNDDLRHNFQKFFAENSKNKANIEDMEKILEIFSNLWG